MVGHTYKYTDSPTSNLIFMTKFISSNKELIKHEYFLHVNSADKNIPKYYKLQLAKDKILILSFSSIVLVPEEVRL